MKRFCLIGFLLFIIFNASVAQTELFNQDITYSRQDSLRGSITAERAWWNLKKYELDVTVDIPNKSLKGTNLVTYEVLGNHDLLQIDLQEPMKIISASQDKKELEIIHEGNAHFIKLKKKQKKGSIEQVKIAFEGKPVEAENAPWDGGFTWTEDSNGKPFIANANQGIGASLWWPCKDHGYDEPEDGLTLSITVPNDLVAVGNGRLIETNEAGSMKTFTWKVINPINNYGVNINIGDYVNFSETYEGLGGELDMDYWVLRENEEKAREQFKQAPMTIKAYEYWFGPYPFYEDSYKLVEVPYLGMEHQSSVTYGNNYKNGYNGRGRGIYDYSGTGVGKKWDFIIVHETGHEWFANNITAKDVADLWIHESFTSYSESLYTEYHFGKEKAAKYALGTRRVVQNDAPMIGDYEVNKEGSSDIYYKGHNMLHTLRHIIGDDEKWRSILIGLNKDFYHQTVTSKEVEDYVTEKAGIDLSKFFDQYLREANIPTLEYKIEEGEITYRWADVVANFEMPLEVDVDGDKQTLKPTTSWQTIVGKNFSIDQNFYVNSREL